RDFLRGYLNITLGRPVKELWIHGVFFFKYNQYQKFPIDLNENLCGWLSGKSKSYLLDWSLKDLMAHTNLNHPCPYVGDAYVKVDNFSIKELLKFDMLLPAGRFRVDINFTEGHNKPTLLGTRTFFSISDNRIEQF
ncbi:uncharacterized protein LOC116344937, partial [Contarinia nasturtii]|uniref:uncharacterized protein LOC116344937 n=1 Tax=Contarinia nasturtii TaxID=265458 RepID=UPI0012D489F8